ncbi:MAG TPA: histidine--tRNA ligase [Armatimonadota bacterium]|nr:histidine--tRNA ligase [Armatimonadota bacterium]
MRYAAPRGTADILPRESPRWRYVEEKFREVCRLYGYDELRTPTFEETELFARSIGEHTDIVSKEMYTFRDRAHRSMTLRPEGTAPVVRAYLQHNLSAEKPVTKLYYITSIFRYERPQKGRYREHHQVGVEALGSPDPAIDAEVISLAMHYLIWLGIRGLELRMNSIGCPDCRPEYMEELKKAVEPYLTELCESCRTRYGPNPLRMLDCKVPRCRELMVNVPNIVESLCQECSEHLSAVEQYLKSLDITYTLDPRLVRGFDYYTKTAFEIVSGELGAQNAVAGGGRYDGLVAEMGGPPTPAVGFGLGIERLLAILDAQGIEIPGNTHPSVFVATVGDAPREVGIKLLADLRKSGVAAEADYAGKSLKAQMKAADREQVRLTVIIGEDELSRGQVKIRDMETKEETDVPLDEAVTVIKGMLGRR